MNTVKHTLYSKQQLDDIIEWFDTHSDSIRISWLPVVAGKGDHCDYYINWQCEGDRFAYWMHGASRV